MEQLVIGAVRERPGATRQRDAAIEAGDHVQRYSGPVVGCELA
jgi:hypothetical protein